MEEDNKSLSLPMRMFVKFSWRQMQLLKSITTAVIDINSVKPFLLSNKVDEYEAKLGSFQEEAVQLDMVLDSPIELWAGREKEELAKRPDLVKVVVEFSGMTRGEPIIRQGRIFTLLEHLERRISDKRATVNFNRTMMISVVAILLAVASIAISLIGQGS